MVIIINKKTKSLRNALVLTVANPTERSAMIVSSVSPLQRTREPCQKCYWWKNNWWKPQKRGCTSCGLPWHPSQHVSTFSQLQYFQLQNQFDSPDKLWNRGQNSLDLVAPALQVFSLIAFSTHCNKNTWLSGRSLSDFAHLIKHYTEHVTRLIV